VQHFFSHYKDLEPGKFVRVGEYDSAAAAVDEIMQGVAACQAKARKES
jgi:inorganic pyrophosphatase